MSTMFPVVQTFPLPLPATQQHDLMGGREGERVGDAMQLVATRL